MSDDLQESSNDAVVGRALVWSFGVLCLIGLVVGGYYLTRRPPPPPIVERTVIPPAIRSKPKVEIPSLPFVEVTSAAGIRFRHNNGAAGEKLLPETMGGGCAVLDYDGDGDQDLLLVNSCRWPWDDRAAEGPVPTQVLYRNDGGWKFTDATAEAGLNVTFYGQGVAVGDYDNDGDPDLFFSAVGTNHLFRNDQGRFVEVTDEAGLAGNPAQWSTGCGFVDYDNDGDLDLVVVNYVQWTREFDLAQPFTLTGRERAYGRPQNFPGTFPYLYRNDGSGKFTEVAEAAGLHVKNRARDVPAAKSLGLTFADLDNDGWMDIVIANDTVQNFLFHNKKDGTFEEMGVAAGIAFDHDGNARGAMGCDTARFRNSPAIGIAIGNFANEMSALYVARKPNLQFNDEAIASGFGPQTRLELTFGMLFVDLDLDGRLDIVAANGHLEEEIHKVQTSQHYEQPPHLFWNCGGGHDTEFVPVPKQICGEDFLKPMVGRGATYADFDGDGDLDIVFAGCGSAPRLLRNDQQLNHHWLRVLLRGQRSNRSAIGAQVEVAAGKQTLFRQVCSTRSYLSQTELPVSFGLGDEAAIDRLTIRWPSGKVQKIDNPTIDKLLIIEEPSD